MKELISIIIPMYNEEESLPYLYERLVKLSENIPNYNMEFLFVNDGSKDRSLEIVKQYKENDSRVCYLNLSRNFGKEIAMAAALDYVKGDVVAIIDADLQDPPELISHSFYRVLRSVSSVPIQEDTGDFRLLSRRAVEALKSFPEKQRYTKGMFSLIGFKKKAIEFDRDPRVAGTTKWNYFKLFDLAIEGITSFTVAPLRIATIIGMVSAIGAIGYMVFTLFKTIIRGVDVPGYASLVCIILLLGGIQLVCLGIIGEYLGRIFIEVKNRPLYFIDEYSGNENYDK